MEANRRCKVAEETIDTETANVKKFSKTVEEKEAEVNSAKFEYLFASEFMIV